jgi:phenylacetate-CoA ligase
LLKKVVGRTSDSIRTREGRIIHGEYFTHIFYGLNGVRRFQFIQESYDNYVVKVQLTHDADTTKIREAIIKECTTVLGNATRITIEFVDEIPVTTSGKFRFTISKIQKQ